ncbi:hypothetical protein ACFL0W_04815 [Nanoarchaeota archaeon]
MVSPLAEYIKQQLDRGYDITTIRNFLISQQYPVSSVDQAITEVYQSMKPQQAVAPQYAPGLIPKPQVRPDLVSFIQQNLKQGYRIEAIRNYLVSQGYQSFDVENAINYVNQQVQKKPSSKKILVPVIAVVLIIIAFVGYNFIFQGPEVKPTEITPERLLDLKMELSQKRIAIGDSLQFVFALTNFGTKGRFDVKMTYDIVDMTTEETIAFSEETLAIETSLSKVVEIELPDDLPTGRYKVDVKATYKDQEADSSELFRIMLPGEEDELPPEPPVIEPVPVPAPEKEDNVTVTPPPEPLPITPVTDVTIVSQESFAKVMAQIKNSLSISPQKTEEVCEEAGRSFESLCYGELAKNTRNDSYCEKIEEYRRDSCYLSLMYIGLYSVCEKISDKALMDSCMMMRSSLSDEYKIKRNESTVINQTTVGISDPNLLDQYNLTLDDILDIEGVSELPEEEIEENLTGNYTTPDINQTQIPTNFTELPSNQTETNSTES